MSATASSRARRATLWRLSFTAAVTAAAAVLLLPSGGARGESICSADGLAVETERLGAAAASFLRRVEQGLGGVALGVELVEAAGEVRRAVNKTGLDELDVGSPEGHTLLHDALPLRRRFDFFVPQLGDRAVDDACVRDLAEEDGLAQTLRVLLSSRDCPRPRPRRLDELCEEAPYNEDGRCPPPADRAAAAREAWPDCPTYCLYPERYDNDIEQYYMDLGTSGAEQGLFAVSRLLPGVTWWQFAGHETLQMYTYAPTVWPLGLTAATLAASQFGADAVFTRPFVSSLVAPGVLEDGLASTASAARWTSPFVSSASVSFGTTFVSVAVPVYAGRTYLGSASAAVRLSAFGSTLAAIELPDGGSALAVDSSGVVIATGSADVFSAAFCPASGLGDDALCSGGDFNFTRLREVAAASGGAVTLSLGDSLTGFDAVAAEVARMAASGAASSQLRVSLAGVDSYVAFSAVGLEGTYRPWYVVVAVPSATVDSVARWRTDRAAVVATLGDEDGEGDEDGDAAGVPAFAVTNDGDSSVPYEVALPDGWLAAEALPAAGVLPPGATQVIRLNLTGELALGTAKAGVVRVRPRLAGVGAEGGDAAVLAACFRPLAVSVSLAEPRSGSSSVSATVVLAAVLVPVLALLVAWVLFYLRLQARSAEREAERLQAKATRDADFVAFTFHEVRNPLSGAAALVNFARTTLRKRVAWTPNSAASADGGGPDLGGGSSPPGPGPLPASHAATRPPPVVTAAESLPPLDGSSGFSLPLAKETSSTASSMAFATGLAGPGDVVIEVAAGTAGGGGGGGTAPAPAPAPVDVDAAGHGAAAAGDIESALDDLDGAATCLLHTADVLQHVMDIALLADGRLELRPEPAGLHSLLASVVTSRAAGHRHVRVECNTDRLTRRNLVMVDSRRLRQVLGSLLSFSLETTREGHVTLGCRRAGSGGLVRFWVADTGDPLGDDERRGIEEARQGVRLARDGGVMPALASRRASLDVAARVVRLMGGLLTADGPDDSGLAPGGGGAFTKRLWFEVSLPVARPEFDAASEVTPPLTDEAAVSRRASALGAVEAEAAGSLASVTAVDEERPAATAAAAAAGAATGARRQAQLAHPVPVRRQSGASAPKLPPAGWRVLVVDDVRLNRAVLKRVLTSGPVFGALGWTVEQAINGEEALERLTKLGERYDLVTMDENMQLTGGKLSGSETVRQFRAYEAEAGLPRVLIAAVSGNVADDDVRRYRESGMDVVWGKPLPPAEHILAEIQASLEVIPVALRSILDKSPRAPAAARQRRRSSASAGAAQGSGGGPVRVP